MSHVFASRYLMTMNFLMRSVVFLKCDLQKYFVNEMCHIWEVSIIHLTSNLQMVRVNAMYQDTHEFYHQCMQNVY